MEITQEYLKQCLTYDSDTGIFKWRADRPDWHFKDWRGRNGFMRAVGLRKDMVAGYDSPPSKRNPCSYVIIGLNNKPYKAHRLAWLYVYGNMPVIDFFLVIENASLASLYAIDEKTLLL